MLGVQIVTGIVLAMHYTPEVTLAFDSVEAIRRDVNGGRTLQAVHAVGASMFFFAVYIHIFRGLYFGSYKAPREVLWILGVIIFLLMMATAFFGYVLPWGQMSFWAAAVITNIFAAIPVIGDPLLQLLRGGFAVDNPTLNRLLLAALPPAVHHRGSGRAPYLGAACAGQQQPDRRRSEIVARHGAVPPVLHDEGFLRRGGVLHPLRLVRVLRAQHAGPPGQLHPGQPAGGRRRTSCRNGTSCRSTPSCAPSTSTSSRFEAARRHLLRRLDPDPVLPALARYEQGPLGHVPADVQMVLLAVRGQLHPVDVVRRADARPQSARAVHGGRYLKTLGAVLFRLFHRPSCRLLSRFEKPRPLPNSISEAVLKPAPATI